MGVQHPLAIGTSWDRQPQYCSLNERQFNDKNHEPDAYNRCQIATHTDGGFVAGMVF